MGRRQSWRPAAGVLDRAGEEDVVWHDEGNLEEQEARQAAEAERRAAQAAANREPTREERIAREKKRLEDTIADLEEKPLDFFGSFKNKRVRLGYYRYRLETLNTDPDKYFSQPTRFQGNVKKQEE